MTQKDIPFSPKTHQITRDELRSSLERYSRAPFQDVLAQLLQCQPTEQNFLTWAAEHPDKWAAALSIMARLAGFTDTTVSVNLDLDLSKMGDAQLLQKLQEIRQQSGLVDITPVTIGQTIEKAAQSNRHTMAQALEQPAQEDDDAKLLALMQKKSKRKTPRISPGG